MKKSKIILSITIGVSIILVATGIIYYALTNRENKVIAQIKQSLENRLTLEDGAYEYGSEITLQELNLDNNVKVYIDNQQLNNTYKFTEVGEYKLKAETSQTYKNFLNKEEIITAEKEATIKIEDTKNAIIEGVSDKEIIEGEVDTTKVGEYEIKVKATDKNNNTTEVTYKVKVNAKPEEVVKGDTNTNSSNKSTQTYTNKSSKSTTGESTNSKNNNTTNKVEKNNSTQNKSNITTDKDNSRSTSDSSTSSEKQATYQGTTDGKKYYFQDRGEEGNYGEKFTW